jgi:hypothetical protein
VLSTTLAPAREQQLRSLLAGKGAAVPTADASTDAGADAGMAASTDVDVDAGADA